MSPVSDAPLCLVVEDEALIAMALEACLEDAGFLIAGPFMRNADALDWLADHTPDLALLDVLLKDGPCTSIVRALRQRKIPFAIYSGLKPRSLPPELAGTRWLEKPVSREDLTQVLRDIVSETPAGASRTPVREPAELIA